MNYNNRNLVKILCLAIVGSFLLPSTGCAAATALTVISPDSPLPSVVIPEQTEPLGPRKIWYRDIAADFCAYFSQVSGRAVVPVATPAADGVIIHIGPTEFARRHAPEIDDLFADGYVIKHVRAEGRDHIILAGRMGLPRATYWATEQFLKDHCGVRWLFHYPSKPEYGEVVPERPTISIPSNLAEKIEPDFASRGKLGLWYSIPSHAPVHGLERPEGYLSLSRQGGYQHRPGYGDHQIQFMFTQKEYESNPEWFAFFTLPERRATAIINREHSTYAASDKVRDALARGERRGRWHWSYGNGWQICTSNQGTVDHAVAFVLDYLAKNPDVPLVSVGPNDGWGECECPDCTAYLASAEPAYTVSERWWRWVNQVARKVAKTHPNVWIESLAYSQTSSPPRFKLEPNVAVTKSIVLDHEIKQAEQWGEVCTSVNLYTYPFGGHLPAFRHYPDAMQDFLKWGKNELGAVGHAPESAGNWTFDGPKPHYTQALHWDVNADVDAVMDDFCKHSYGKAAAPMRAFWDRHELTWENRPATPYAMTDTRFMFYQWPSWAMQAYLLPNHEFAPYAAADVEYLDNRIAEAVKLAAPDSEAVQFRVARLADAWYFVRTMLLSKLEYYDQPGIPAITSPDTLQQAVARARRLADLRRERVKYFNELSAYPEINPNLSLVYLGASGIVLFSHEQTWLDDLCSALSGYLSGSAGRESAGRFWQAIPEEDSLHEYARTQLYLLENPENPSQMANGDFEKGDVSGWTVSGTVAAVSEEGRSGKFAASMDGGDVTLSQNLEVAPGERYRLTAWLRYVSPPPADAVAMEVRVIFFSGTTRVQAEPMRHVFRDNSSEDWVKLSVSLTVPSAADRLTIDLMKRFNGTVLLDDVSLEKILAGEAP